MAVRMRRESGLRRHPALEAVGGNIQSYTILRQKLRTFLASDANYPENLLR